MARKLGKKDNRYLAKLVTEKRAPCAFCLREVDDEITFGKLYSIGDIQCHYFCCLLSCCLIQKGHDDEGLFGFMYADIIAEIERCKKHKCSYCSRIGANIGCCVGVCRKQFHLPCGREKNAISLYYGTYKSFCQQHAPKQKIPEHIMAKAKLRRKVEKMKVKNIKEINSNSSTAAAVLLEEDSCDKAAEPMICVICYETVDGFPTIQTFWPLCCARDAWFHRSCVQRMALSAGMHYLKCPLCNDKENFYEAVVSQGYYVPDRDAAWELEQNAFAEIYERPTSCSADECLCPMGREHDAENGKWDIKLCLLCGSEGAHAQCIVDQSQPTRDRSHDQSEDGARSPNQSDSLSADQSNVLNLRYVCRACFPAAPEDLSALANNIEAIIQQEQAESVSNARRHVMPSRMSLRRTKGRLALLNAPSSSRSFTKTETESSDSQNTQASRLELNLKTPRRPRSDSVKLRDDRYIETKMMSPVKLLEQSFKEKVVCTGVRDAVLDDTVIETLRKRFRKPRPLCEKKKIVNDILDGLFDSLMKDSSKQKDQVKDWCSPKRTYNAMEVSKVEKYKDKENGSITKTSNEVNTSNKIIFGSDDIKINKQIKLKSSPLKIILKKELCLNKSNQKLNKIEKVSNESFPVENTQHIESVENINTIPKEDLLKEICQPTIKEMSNHDSGILRDLTTEKDLHSQLLLELTTDKIKDKNEGPIELIENLLDTTIDNDTPKNLTESRNNFIESQNMETPKRKTIDMEQNSSLEISENDQSISIDVIKINDSPTNSETYKQLKINVPEKNKKCAFKFSPLDKEALEEKNVGIDVESFKKEYLSEVDREFTCKFKHKHVDASVDEPKFRTAIDFALGAIVKKETVDKSVVLETSGKKRKVSESGVRLLFDSNVKKRKMSESDLKLSYNGYEKPENNIVDEMPIIDRKDNKKVVKTKRKKETKERRKGKKNKKVTNNKDIEVTIDSAERRSGKSKKSKKKIKTKFAIQNQNIHVKIKWKKKQLSLNIESKKKAKKEKKKNISKFKQYILKFSEDSSKEMLVKPEKEVCHIKKKCAKLGKSPDNLKQTSIQSFFKSKPPEE